ncbi:ribonuclease P [Malassezia psittaci]|uniref:Ribonuclease P n=1 Tax=Malassezia psittaci TaxID=1821823 RepID=A0AAF0JJF2_9BASI|nr:ribonuclease P [Malassezia psittaci]
MFYDLNITWPTDNPQPSSTKKSKKKAGNNAPTPYEVSEPTDPLSQLSPAEQVRMTELTYELRKFGYGTIAYNHVVYGKYDPNLHQNPFQRRGTRPSPPFPDLDKRTGRPARSSATLTQYSRLTIVLDKDNLVNSGTGLVSANSNALLAYDFLSVMPLTETAFQHACITLSELKPFSIDIISLDLASAPRLPFHLRRSTVGAALANGVVFEICYGPALETSNVSNDIRDPSTLRRNFFSNTRDLLRITNGKGVILSSGAREAFGLRGPYDVMNL